MAKYRCDSPECINKPHFEGPKGLNRCLHCGASDPKPIRSYTMLLVSTLLLFGLVAMVWFFPTDSIPFSPAPPLTTSVDSGEVVICEIVGFANTSTDNCLLQLKPLYRGVCEEGEAISYREVGKSYWSELNAGSSISMVGKQSITLEFQVDDAFVKDTTIIGMCSRLSPSDLEERKKEIIRSVKDFFKNPISEYRYGVYEKTKHLPSGKVILPDGTSSSGIRWQMDVYMLWPNEELNLEVDLDDYGTIQSIKLS